MTVTDLAKTYRTPFRRKKVEALRGVSFEVAAGEVFGFLGPNGAGKTTTIRCLMGLCSITGGKAEILGAPVPTRAARQRMGFLPEQPYFYDYLTVGELLDLGGRLFGMSAADRRARADLLIVKVGLDRARGLPLKKFSKGMMQRAGLALALINDPELVVLDEPMSGLDPIGRKEIRDLILEQRDGGKTVFFSSHILSDVESICDRVAICVAGTIRDIGRPSDLVDATTLDSEVRLALADDAPAEAVAAISARASTARRVPGELLVTVAASSDLDDLLAFARGQGARVLAVTPRHETLEDLFLRRVEDERKAGTVPL
ncbi:MAG: ABC transporter ATP-binding protein [Myxococcales bacterium]|nr:ABC transporter ATP-binding protein [Myxococcales bacterium]